MRTHTEDFRTYTVQVEKDRTETFTLKFTRRDYGGWIIRRKDTGRELGWVVQSDDGLWSSHVAGSAFLGDGPTDEGDLLDKVEWHLFNSPDGFKSSPIDYDRTRTDAAFNIVHRLANYEAPAVGFGRHSGVSRWADRKGS